jgi:hypothetical protein
MSTQSDLMGLHAKIEKKGITSTTSPVQTNYNYQSKTQITRSSLIFDMELGKPSELLQSKMDYVFDYIFNNVNLFTHNKWKCRIRLLICFVAGLCIRMVLTTTGSVGSQLDRFSPLICLTVLQI